MATNESVLEENGLTDWQKMIAKQREEVNLVRRGLVEIVERSHFADVVLDKPEDRLYHAEDASWWKREGNKLVSATPPEGWMCREEKAEGDRNVD